MRSAKSYPIQKLFQTIHVFTIFCPDMRYQVMYSLAETLKIQYGREPTGDLGSRFQCMELTPDRARLTNLTQGLMSCYTFNLITSGHITLRYIDRELTLSPDDLYIYTPGQPITVLSVSDDLLGYVLLTEESLTLESHMVRKFVRAAYRPLTVLHEPMIHLIPADAQRLCASMQQIIARQETSHRFQNETLKLSIDLFLLDVLDMQDRAVSTHIQPSNRSEELFFRFIEMLPRHFLDHRDLDFYASGLNISTVYLSRIVRQMTGRTVVDHINQMLLMEASFLLTTTSLSVAQVADRLHFADASSFCKFFSRQKGISPRRFREQ